MSLIASGFGAEAAKEMRPLVILGLAGMALIWLITLRVEPETPAASQPQGNFLSSTSEDLSRRLAAGRAAAAGGGAGAGVRGASQAEAGGASSAGSVRPIKPIASGPATRAPPAPSAPGDPAEIWSAPAQFAPIED